MVNKNPVGKKNNRGQSYKQRQGNNKINYRETNKSTMKCTCGGRTNHKFIYCKYKSYFCNLCTKRGQLAYNCYKNINKTNYILKDNNKVDSKFAKCFNNLFHVKEDDNCSKVNRREPIMVK